ncbi:MAG: Lrp/AsnC family transcriptional regulator, partial [Candidatus Lokiarchaeota archaeon]
IHSLMKIPQLKMLDGIFGEFSLFALFIFQNYEEFNQTLKVIDDIMSRSHFKKYQIIEPIKVYKTHGIELTDNSIKPIDLDKVNLKVLQILQFEQGGKLLSTYDINKKFDLDKSQSTIYNRIKAMKKANVILSYAINFNPRLLGFKGKFILRIKPRNPSHYDDLARNLGQKNEIIYLFRIGEQFGLLAIVRVKKIENYGKFIKNLYESEEVGDTYTNFVLDERKKFVNFKIY